jgi:hypothetical protein
LLTISVTIVDATLLTDTHSRSVVGARVIDCWQAAEDSCQEAWTPTEAQTSAHGQQPRPATHTHTHIHARAHAPMVSSTSVAANTGVMT